MTGRCVLLVRNRKAIEVVRFEEGTSLPELAERIRAREQEAGWTAAAVWIVPAHIRVSPRVRQPMLRALHRILKRDPAGLGVLPGEWE